MQRFFVNKDDISDKQVVISDSPVVPASGFVTSESYNTARRGRRVHQIRNVLRMETGDEIVVLDNTGTEYHVILTSISQKEVIGTITQKKQCETEPRTKITLYQSLVAREKLEFIFQKCTETGVSSFVPVVTERSIVRNSSKITKEKLSRYENIISEAAEQSHRGIIPVLKSPINLNWKIMILLWLVLHRNARP